MIAAGAAMHGVPGCGMVWQCMAGRAWQVRAWQGQVGPGMAVVAGYV